MVMIFFSNNAMLISIEDLSGSNNSNTNTIKSDSNTSGDLLTTVINTNNVAKAVLVCHPNSHSFLDRTLILDNPIRIGRSVGHNKTSVNNGIFDCKVLSRNHALLWFDDGKFLLRDTKSSNGTFVNTERLSKSNEESPPREIFSGDTVQFGVDVVENNRNVTHGCVIATLKLFLPNGRESKPILLPVTSSDRNTVTLENLYHLNQYLQESLQREQMLESKLNALQTLMMTLRDSTELGWKALITNNNLLSRVELLEVQLKCSSQKFAKDELRDKLRTLQEDKSAYEGVVKQYFQKILDEKIVATQRFQDLNRALEDTKTEFANTRQMMLDCQTELRELASKNTRLKNETDHLEFKLQVADETNKEAVQKLTDENTFLLNQVKNLSETEQVLRQTIKELETRGDRDQEKVMSLQNQVEELQKHHGDILCELVNPVIIKDKINDIELVHLWMSIYTEALKKCKENAAVVGEHVEQLMNEKQAKQRKVEVLNGEMSEWAIHLRQYKEEEAKIAAEISERKNETEMFNRVPDILDEISEKMCNENEVLEKKKLLNVIQRDITLADDALKESENLLNATKEELLQVSVSCTIEKEKLNLAENQLGNLEAVVRTLNEHVEHLEVCEKEKNDTQDVQSVKGQLSESYEMAQKKQNRTEKLVKQFSNFIEVINKKLTVVEDNFHDFQTMQIPQENSWAEELESLKIESSRLVQAVNELQSEVHNVKSYIDAGKSADSVCREQMKLVSKEVKSNFEKVTDMVILKEKYRSSVEEKLLIENEYVKLKEQYESLRRYPYFDFYFLLPFLGILFASVFSFGDKLSFFDTKK